MEEITTRADADDEIEAAGEALFSGDLFSSAEVQRISALEASESWSEDDVKFASEFAETMLHAVTGFYDVVLTVLNRPFDEMSSLRPPEHLSDLHGNFIATAREALQLLQAQVESVKNASTEIKNREDLADFQDIVNSLESGPSDPELQQKAEELAERGEATCRALRERLEAELERDVYICNAAESDAVAVETVAAPAPTAAGTPEPTTAATRESAPAPDAASAETDRQALVALYNATGGPSWTNNGNWLSDRPLDEWYGVETDDGRVIGLMLSANGLNGSIPAELGQLSYLDWLDLYTNQLSGNIPPELGRLSYLVGLVLNDNQLTGAIPAELGQLSYLEHLRLDSNNLTGAIPAELGRLSNLDYLDLADNDLSGAIPTELGQLSLLTGLYLAGNDLRGCVPGELGNVEENDIDELGLPSC
ncbi:MAG: hypothetical protein OXR64_05290 [Chloroflexota bacterium]|nr:hypothetical protein [Chloroflexota bacterium]MDE2919243.1 hypothetical protein [Chloroflexota bacterium]